MNAVAAFAVLMPLLGQGARSAQAAKQLAAHAPIASISAAQKIAEANHVLKLGDQFKAIGETLTLTPAQLSAGNKAALMLFDCEHVGVYLGQPGGAWLKGNSTIQLQYRVSEPKKPHVLTFYMGCMFDETLHVECPGNPTADFKLNPKKETAIYGFTPKKAGIVTLKAILHSSGPAGFYRLDVDVLK